jgi:hypothetical protein
VRRSKLSGTRRHGRGFLLFISFKRQTMHTRIKRLLAIMSVLLMSAMQASVGIAGSTFQGTWKVKDTSGKPFEISLAADGTAKATLPKEGMTGSWKEEVTWPS